MYKAILALVLGLMVSACASVPMAPQDADASGKSFAPPAPGQAALYVYREGIFGGALALNVSMGQRLLGALGPDTWFRVDVPPGTYDIRCLGQEASDSKMIELAVGEIRFVEAAMRLGFVAARCAVFEVDAAKGRQAVLSGKRAQEIR